MSDDERAKKKRGKDIHQNTYKHIDIHTHAHGASLMIEVTKDPVFLPIDSPNHHVPEADVRIKDTRVFVYL
jgi:hypothetical protein